MLGRVPPLRSNWREVLFTALVLAAKVWDDTGSSNAEFADAARIFSLKDVTYLETRFLCLIEYNVNVSRQLYTTCYFELRDLCESQDDHFPVRPAAVSELRDLGRRDLEPRCSRRAYAQKRGRAKSVHIWQRVGTHGSLPPPPTTATTPTTPELLPDDAQHGTAPATAAAGGDDASSLVDAPATSSVALPLMGESVTPG